MYRIKINNKERDFMRLKGSLTMGTRILSRAFLFLLFFGLAVSAPEGAAAESLEEPQKVIQKISDELQAILKKDRKRLKNDPAYVYRLADEILVPHIDFGRVSSLALGKHWRRARPAQKKEFVKQFKLLLIRTYATAFTEIKEWEIRHMPVKRGKRKGDVFVRTKVLRPGAQPVSVDYRMYLSKSGRWKVYNVKIENISLITTYRTKFQQEIRRGGMDGLIRLLKSKNNKRVKKLAADEEAANAG
jgi:phospholipid transport system substrate-binding protein